MDVTIGPKRRLRAKELMLSNCGAREDSWELLGQARRSSQSILQEINPEFSLEGLTLKLKQQYFGHLMQRADSLEKTLLLGKIEGRKRGGDRGWCRWCHPQTLWDGEERESWCAEVYGVAKSCTRLSDSTTPSNSYLSIHRKLLNSLTWDVWFL